MLDEFDRRDINELILDCQNALERVERLAFAISTDNKPSLSDADSAIATLNVMLATLEGL